jgi:hypothetical protein
MLCSPTEQSRQLLATIAHTESARVIEVLLHLAVVVKIDAYDTPIRHFLALQPFTEPQAVRSAWHVWLGWLVFPSQIASTGLRNVWAPA